MPRDVILTPKAYAIILVATATSEVAGFTVFLSFPDSNF